VKGSTADETVLAWRMSTPSKREIIFWLGLTTICVAVLYLGITPRNQMLARQGYVFFAPETWIDAKIPLVPELIWPYYLYFPLLMSSAFAARKRREWLHQGAVAFVVASAIGAAFYIALPSQIIQPDLHACPTLSCKVLQVMYGTDDGYHVFPSMHVAMSCLSASLYWSCDRKYAAIPIVLAIAIVFATVLCKRHFFVDLPAGMVVTVISRLVGFYGGRWLCDTVGSKIRQSETLLRLTR
jgi:membrane-associated phospholipid phosphatase